MAVSESTSVKLVSLESANVKVDNSNDGERVYDIQCNVTVNGSEFRYANTGIVRNKETQNVVSNFEVFERSSNVQFVDVEDAEQLTILEHIQRFIDSVKNYMSENGNSIITNN